jgi:spermidine synthase
MLELVFFASGASGLVYQIIWVRQFGNAFGSNVSSAALVTAIFMLGLGAGSFVGGRIADARTARSPGWPLRAYGVAEVAIGILSAIVALSHPALESISASISTYASGADGWFRPSAAHDLVRYASAVLLLSPITLLMGATLSILIRHVIRTDFQSAGHKVAVLYGSNTLGAAFGCIITDFLLVPAFGIFATQLIAVSVNLAAGASAFFLARRSVPTQIVPDEHGPERTRALSFVWIALAASGFASLGMEILWFRQLSAMLRSQRSVFSLLLAVVLIATALGTALVPRIERRFRADRAYAVAVAIFVVAALGGLATLENQDLIAVDRMLRDNLALSPWGWRMQEFSSLLTPILQTVALPAVALGTTYPLANIIVQRASGEVGHRAGTLYLANTAGAVGGALMSGFVLLPQLGVQRAAGLLMIFACASIVAIGLASEKRAAVLPLAGAVSAVAIYLALPADHLSRQLILPRFQGQRVVAMAEGLSESVAVIEDLSANRRLLTNGFSMSGTSLRAQRYMRLMVHFPLLQLEAPKDALVVAFGVGNSADAATMHPLEHVDVVDLSETILGLAGLFAATNDNVLADPKVRVFVNDGRQHLRMDGIQYDLITSEPPPVTNAGIAALYSIEYYRLARARLKPNGWITQWLPLYQLTEEDALSVVRAFIDVFPAAILLSGSTDELILVGYAGERIDLDPDLMARTLEARPKVAADLARLELSTPAEIIGTLVSPTSQLLSASRAAAPVTDDWPITEYHSVLFAPIRRSPKTLFAPLALAENCTACFEGDDPRQDLDALGALMRAQNAYFLPTR